MTVDEPSQGSKGAPRYSPSRSPVSMRFHGVLSQKQQRASSVSKKLSEPLRRAVADCLSSTAPNVHGNPSLLSYEPSRTLRDYLANTATVDMAYTVLIEHALAERDRSPAVVPRCITLLKRFLLRYVPKVQTLRQIDSFCENSIVECESITKQRVSLWSKSLGQHSGAATNVLPSLSPASSFASASLVKSLNYVRSLVAQHLPKQSFQPLGISGTNFEVDATTDSPKTKDSSLQSSLKVPTLDTSDSGTNEKYIYSDLLNWRLSGDRDYQLPYMIRESVLKARDLAHAFVEAGAAALLFDTKINEKSWKFPISQDLPDVDPLFRPSSATMASNFGSVGSHLKAIAASKRMKGGPQQVWENVSVSTFRARAHPLFQYRHYSEQQPLWLNPAEICEVIAEACSETSSAFVNYTMSSPMAKYNARPVTEVAISVLIKLVVDMYVMDSAAAAPLTLSMLEDMLSSQSVPARIRVFDLILNLGVHAHLLEPVSYDDSPPIVEEEALQEPALNNEDQDEAGNVNDDVNVQERTASAIETFEHWLLVILFEVLHFLVQMEEREEIVWASALSCLFYFVCHTGNILRKRLEGLDIRVVKALLEVSREYSWAEVVHCKLICMLTNLFYRTHSGSAESLGDTSTFLVEQVNLLGGINFICLEYSQAKSREEKRNLFLVLFDYALDQINKGCLAAGASAYSFDEVQLVASMLTLANAPEAFYTALKHGLEGIGEVLKNSISVVFPRSSNSGHLDLMCDMLFSQLCLRLPDTNCMPSGLPKSLEKPIGHTNEPRKGDSESYLFKGGSRSGKICCDNPSGSIFSGDESALIQETASLAALVLHGRAIVPMQLVSRVPASLFYWPLIQLAGAATDDIALGVAVGSAGRANLPGATSDIRAALLLLLIGKCTADSKAFLEVEGEEFFRGLLDDTDPRVAYCSAAFLLKRMMSEEPENYQRLLQSLIIKAQQFNNEKLLENPYLQMRGILQLVNDPAG